MSERMWTSLIAGLILIAAATPAILIQDEQIYRTKVEFVQYRDTLYLPNSEYVRAVTCGYDQFAAHFLWLRMIQSFAAGWTRPENVQQMMQYFEVITDLDPHFMEAYSLAIMAVSEKVKRFDLVDRIVEKAYLNNPGKYTIPFKGAYTAYWDENNAEKAKFYVRLGLHDPDMPDYANRWLAYFDMKEGRYRAAYEYSVRNYLAIVGPESAKEGAGEKIDQTTKVMYRLNFLRAADGWIRSEIEAAANKYRQDNGKWPTVEQLDEAGLFAGKEFPDFGMIFTITEKIRGGELEKPTDSAQIEQLIQMSIHKWDSLPPSPYAFLKPSYPGWVIWPDSTVVRASGPANKSGRELIVSRGEAMIELMRVINFINTTAVEYKNANGGKLPQSFADFAPQFLTQTDPFGGKFVWDPKSAKVSCTSVPNFNPGMVPNVMW